MKRFIDAFFLTRPIVLIPSWAFLIAGYLRGSESNGLRAELPGDLLPAFFCLTFMLAGVYIVNQIFDRETDKANGKLFLLAEDHISLGAAWIEAGILVLLSLGFAALSHPSYLPWLVASGIVGAAYSIEPIRLKGRAVTDLLANAIGYGGIAWLFGYSVAAPVTGGAVLASIPYVLLVGAVFVHTAVVDRPGDEKAGLHTTASLLGDRGSAILALVLVGGSLVTGIVLGEPYPPVAILGGAVFFVWTVVRPGIKASSLCYQWAALAFVLLIIVQAPQFGLLLLGVVILTRLYYKFRFGLNYPHLDF